MSGAGLLRDERVGATLKRAHDEARLWVAARAAEDGA